MPLLIDRVQETTTTTGTGSFALEGAVTGYQSFLAGVGVGHDCVYACVASTSPDWEVGIGTLTGPTTLARTTVTASSNAGNPVSFPAGNKNVFVDASAWLLNPLANLAAGQLVLGGSDGRVAQAPITAAVVGFQSWTNGDTGTHALGQAVYASGQDVVRLAQANLIQTCNVVALCADATVASSATGHYQTSGLLGGLSGLTRDVPYYLDPVTPGAVTQNAPSSVGLFVVEVGVATSTTEILIRPRILASL